MTACCATVRPYAGGPEAAIALALIAYVLVKGFELKEMHRCA